jgi:hypothetical protein
MGHIFFYQVLRITMEWASTPHATIFHMQSFYKVLKGFAINFMSCLNTMWNPIIKSVLLKHCAQWRL